MPNHAEKIKLHLTKRKIRAVVNSKAVEYHRALMDKKAVKEKEIRRKNPPELQCLFCENRKNSEEYADYFPQERQIKF